MQDVEKAEVRGDARHDTWEEVSGSHVCSYSLPKTSVHWNFEEKP